MLLVFLKVFVDGPVHPDDASEEYEGERRQDDQVVGDVSRRQYLETEEGAAAEELAEEGHDDEDETVADAVCKAVEQHQHRKIGCLEDISYANGWITKEQVEQTIKLMGKSQYGQYLKDVLDGKYINK